MGSRDSLYGEVNAVGLSDRSGPLQAKEGVYPFDGMFMDHRHVYGWSEETFD